MVFDGGGAGSGGTAETVCLATAATGALPLFGNVLTAGVLTLAFVEGNDDFAATGLEVTGFVAVGFVATALTTGLAAIGLTETGLETIVLADAGLVTTGLVTTGLAGTGLVTTGLAGTGFDTVDVAFLAAINLPFTAVVCEVFSDGVFGFGFFELSIGILGADFLVEAEFVVAILATLLGFTDLAAAPFFPLVATTFFAVVVFEVIPMADLEPLAAFSNFLVGFALMVLAVGFFRVAKGFLGADLVFFLAFKVRSS